MPKPDVTLDPRAEADLKELARYIRRHSGKLRASQVLDRIEKKLQTLAFAPRMDRRTTRLEPGSRRFSLPPWIIYYDPIPTGVYVFRVIDGRRDLTAFFSRNS